jgi:hypothetical protein
MLQAHYSHKGGDYMRIEKEVLQNAVQKLAERAEDCFDRAQIQHASADAQHASAEEQHASADKQDASAQRQHSNADKLVTLGVALEADAAELNREIEMRTGRSSPHMEVSDDGTRAIPEPTLS